jgi:predicted nucleic acid-binding Zn ribbon protein
MACKRTEARLRTQRTRLKGHGARYTGKPMNQKKDSLTPLKDILSALLTDSKLPFNPEDATIWKVWDEVVGPGIARNAQPLWIKDRRLRVKVSDPIWLQELSYLEASVRQKLNARLGRQAVEKIEFRLNSR